MRNDISIANGLCICQYEGGLRSISKWLTWGTLWLLPTVFPFTKERKGKERKKEWRTEGKKKERKKEKLQVRGHKSFTYNTNHTGPRIRVPWPLVEGDTNKPEVALVGGVLKKGLDLKGGVGHWCGRDVKHRTQQRKSRVSHLAADQISQGSSGKRSWQATEKR